jgi:diketogulonate reductase-like aldo/keto reductase
MIARQIPASREPVPIIGLGTWRTFDVTSEHARAPLAAVLDRFSAAGGRLIDTSPMYGRAEETVGAPSAHAPAAFIATKVWTRGRAEGIAQMERSMRLLRRADLIQVHNLVDWRTHLATLREWKQSGRGRAWRRRHTSRSPHGRPNSTAGAGARCSCDGSSRTKR